MNRTKHSRRLFRLIHRLMLSTRFVGFKSICKSFGSTANQNRSVIQQIYVVNLDRQAKRWNQIQRELQRIYTGSKAPISEITRRFSAIDARYYTEQPSRLDLQASYSLADQLFVEPNLLLGKDNSIDNRTVLMTRQEIAVALSHIEVWKLIASNNHQYALVLEDDIYFDRDFPRFLDKAWNQVTHFNPQSDAFDILYLSYQEAKTSAEKEKLSDFLFRPLRGLWQLSGYVLSKKGAKKLLDLLPVRGPVDLWINHQFDKLHVFATNTSIIKQRLDSQSDNSYSILPVLSRVGVLNYEKPLLFKKRSTLNIVFAVGREGTGLTSLAMALSMLGYRCCSDIKDLPIREYDDLFGKEKSRIFNAYVNVGSLSGHRCIVLAKLYPRAKFIITVADEKEFIELHKEYKSREVITSQCFSEVGFNLKTIYKFLHQLSADILVLPMQKSRKWDLLCIFLEFEHPSSQYPALEDQDQRLISNNCTESTNRTLQRVSKMQFDSLPWIIPYRSNWQGIHFSESNGYDFWANDTIHISEQFKSFDHSLWTLLDDTFPSNLSIFNPNNFSITNDRHARLTLRKEYARVREYTSASICSNQNYLYGRFSCQIRPAKVPGLVTGVFLHRNSPRQEIDIEFVGKDTTKLLLNVYYNPGDEGANFEYGYRGTPILIDLGFDASKEFHLYSIEWSPKSIRWFVDGRLVYVRANWNPTPIPHLPMKFYINLWYSRSEELAGKLVGHDLPAHSDIKSIEIQYFKS